MDFDPKDDVTLMPMLLRQKDQEAQLGKTKNYICMNHTTTNDLMFQYNLGFGKLVIDDYRVKDYRIQRASKPYSPPMYDSPKKRSQRSQHQMDSMEGPHDKAASPLDQSSYSDLQEFNFGQFYVYCLLKGYGEDPDTIVKYEVVTE